VRYCKRSWLRSVDIVSVRLAMWPLLAGQIIARGKKTWLLRVFRGRDSATGKSVYSNETFSQDKEGLRGSGIQRTAHNPYKRSHSSALHATQIIRLAPGYSRNGEQILSFRGAWEAACKSVGLVSGQGDEEKPTKLFHDRGGRVFAT
jgi:hypothetical protein